MWYFLFIVLVVVPLDGYFIGRGDVLQGCVLILMQTPYLYGIAKEVEGKDCATLFK